MTGLGRITAMNACAMKIRTSVLDRFWSDHISDKYGLRGGHVTVCAEAVRSGCQKPPVPLRWQVTGKVEGWNEEQWVGSYLVASMCIYTKAVLCDGRKRDPSLDLQPTLGIIVEV